MGLRLLLVLALVNYATPQYYTDFSRHECARTCELRSNPKYCHYKISIEYMYSNEPSCGKCENGSLYDCNNSECIIGDGRKRKLVTYNRMMPGPTIQVCKDDVVTIDLTNALHDCGTSLHIHGLSFKDNQFMDGTPMVTQGPIQPHTTFRYNFRATEVGTFPYYSGYSSQQADGAYGILVVRENKNNDQMKNEYQQDLIDHTMVLSTLFREDAQFHRIRNTRLKQADENIISAIAINGVATTPTNNIPAYRYNVNRNNKYKFRVAHVGSESCTMELTIHNHQIKIISMDGQNIEPITVDTLRIFNGERIEFIVETSQPVDAYRIQISSRIYGTTYRSYALLRYNGAIDRNLGYNFVLNKGIVVPCFAEDINCIDVGFIKAINETSIELVKQETFTYFVGFDITNYVRKELRGDGDGNLKTLMTNGISFTNPTRPLLINPRDTTQRTCNRNNKNSNYCSGSNCECVHLINIPLNTISVLVFVNEGFYLDAPYSIHSHGIAMTIIGSGRMGQNVTLNEVERNYKNLNKNDKKSQRKSSFAVPNGGYTIVKFKADNPGYWMIEGGVFYRFGTRLQLVIKVGDVMPQVPENFPRCNDYYGVNMFI